MGTAWTLVASPEHVFAGHEESPDRFQFLGKWKDSELALIHLAPVPAPVEAVAAVHTSGMLERFAAACRQGPGITDFAPTYVTRSSYEDAFLAAGSTLALTRAVLQGQAENAFAIVRPPGHHAEPDAAMGFCLLNNIAIAARDALASGVQRVLIYDFDAHHGNGTQAVFWQEPRVAYFSTHQEMIYPFRTGLMGEAPHARKRIVNLPLPPRSGDAAFQAITHDLLNPLVADFSPDLILVSAGFDSHWNDPLAELGLSSAGYYQLARALVALAKEHCQGRIVFVLEGGYNPVNIASGVEAVFCALASMGFKAQDPSPYPEPAVSDRIGKLRAMHGW